MIVLRLGIRLQVMQLSVTKCGEWQVQSRCTYVASTVYHHIRISVETIKATKTSEFETAEFLFAPPRTQTVAIK